MPILNYTYAIYLKNKGVLNNMNFNFYDMESFKNVFGIANFENQKNNIKLYYLIDNINEFVSNLDTFEKSVKNTIYKLNPNFNGTIEIIEVQVSRKKVKNFNLYVSAPEGKVKITVPFSAKESDIRDFLNAKSSWIEKSRNKISGFKRDGEKNFVSGEIHYLWGNELTLKVVENRSFYDVEVFKDVICFYVKKGSTQKQREIYFKKWLKNELFIKALNFMEIYEKLMGVKVNELKIREMKTKWGTCNVSKKRIWLNLKLVKNEEDFLEYVVVHELVHLLEQSHNSRFKALMSEYMPDWRKRKKSKVIL